MSGRSSRTLARAAILLATAIWGAAFVVVRQALADVGALQLLALRFALAAVLLAPWALRSLPDRQGLRRSLPVGIALATGFILQTYGLRWTTPSRSAFLTGLAVLLVPPLAWATGRARPSLAVGAGMALAGLGLWVLYLPAAGRVGTSAPFGLGDWLTAASAAAFAAHLLLVDRALETVRPAALAWIQFVVLACVCSPSLLRVSLTALSPRAWWAIAATGIFATVIAFACQFYAQKRLGAVETVLVLTLEPAFAAAASIALGEEGLTWTLVAGGALLCGAMLVGQLASQTTVLIRPERTLEKA